MKAQGGVEYVGYAVFVGRHACVCTNARLTGVCVCVFGMMSWPIINWVFEPKDGPTDGSMAN